MDRVKSTRAIRSIRRAFPEDLDALRALATAAAWGLCGADYTPTQIATVLRYGMGADPRLIADGTYYVVEAGRRVVAAGGWSYRAALLGNAHPDYAGGARDVLDPRTDAARVRGFCVHPDFARRGLARAILALCEHAARHAGFTRMELMASVTGRRLYLACGFADVEQVTNIFPNGVTARGYRMTKRLEPGSADVAVMPAAAPLAAKPRWEPRFN